SSFGEANVSELERMARLATPVEQHMVQWPSGQALCLQYTLALDTPQGQLADLSLTQFLVVHGQDGYVLTFATTPGQLARYAPIFEQIGRTFRLLRA
ncbi:MAG: hypothetical protein QME94_02535, partial [Anaerolineae bacterium]|nr:hypothetical protein [Anaerolineae bacterium]